MVFVYTGCGCELSNSYSFGDIMSNSFRWSGGGEVFTCNQALHGCWVLQLSGVILMFRLVNLKHEESCCIYLHKSNSSDVYFGHFCRHIWQDIFMRRKFQTCWWPELSVSPPFHIFGRSLFFLQEVETYLKAALFHFINPETKRQKNSWSPFMYQRKTSKYYGNVTNVFSFFFWLNMA